MKNLLVAILAVTLMSSPAFAANDDGGKKKAKKKAKVECTKDKCCDPANCDPTKCDPKCCDLSACTKGTKEQKCTPSTSCAANKQ